MNKVVLAALTALEPPKATKYVEQLLENEGCHERQDCDILVSILRTEPTSEAAILLVDAFLHQ